MRILKGNFFVLWILIFLFAFITSPRSAHAYKYVLSSGLFLLPGAAQSVDWAVLNNSPNTQSVRVTVYKCNIGTPKTAISPGPLQFAVNPGVTTHNANSVGNTFQHGFSYEVVVETDSLEVLPTVTVWQDNNATVIPGTTILPANFVVSEGQTAVEIILDNAPAGQSGGGRTFTGTWSASIAAGYYGVDSLFSNGSGTDTYRWTPTITVAGFYNVYIRWTSHANRSTAVPIAVTHAGGTTTKTYNQQTGGGVWVLHGTYSFNAGTSGYVQVSDVNGQACADAVRFTPVP